jgi:predicted MFS family arabinose efflux permease
MVFMLIGSTLCAAAQNWGMLLFGRAVQGLSAAGILNMIKIVLSASCLPSVSLLQSYR